MAVLHRDPHTQHFATLMEITIATGCGRSVTIPRESWWEGIQQHALPTLEQLRTVFLTKSMHDAPPRNGESKEVLSRIYEVVQRLRRLQPNATFDPAAFDCTVATAWRGSGDGSGHSAPPRTLTFEWGGTLVVARDLNDLSWVLTFPFLCVEITVTLS